MDVLAADEAGDLLTSRIGAVRSRAEPGAVDDLARLCGRLPLALTVAAAYETEVLTLLGDVQHAVGDLLDARISWRQALTILDDLQHPDAARLRAKLG